MDLALFKDKTLLITGGTGSFGNSVVNKIKDSDIKEIRILSRDEKKQHDMRIRLNNSKIKFIIGDIRDQSTIDSSFKGVDYVFHAAALKQVPSCEFFPGESVRTNIIGTENVINSSVNHGVSKLIVLSTDKAVLPVNAMGISKAMMEKLMVAGSRDLTSSETVLCGTRYGNVMASRGSVIPLFIDQILAGQPLTVTDPTMTRFMMPLSEAIDLVFFAFSHGRNGDIFVQKTPSCTILDLAKALKKIFVSDVPIKVIGTRHGEKKHEVLMNREEMARAREYDDYYCIPADNRDLNYDQFYREGQESVSEVVEYSSDLANCLSQNELEQKLLELDYVREILATNGGDLSKFKKSSLRSGAKNRESTL